MDDCIFCKLASHEIPTSVVYEDDFVFAFNDMDPQAPVHFLVIPKEHISGANKIDSSNSKLIAHIFEVIAKICEEKGIESYRIVNNCGVDAGQSVPHLHFHVMGGREFGWPAG